MTSNKTRIKSIIIDSDGQSKEHVKYNLNKFLRTTPHLKKDNIISIHYNKKIEQETHNDLYKKTYTTEYVDSIIIIYEEEISPEERRQTLKKIKDTLSELSDDIDDI